MTRFVMSLQWKRGEYESMSTKVSYTNDAIQNSERDRVVEQAVGIAKHELARLADEECWQRAVQCAAEQSHGRLQWLPMSVAYGDAGMVLAYTALSKLEPNCGWEYVAHRHLERAVRFYEAVGRRFGFGLFMGLSGLLFAACYASSHGKQYRRMGQTLANHLVKWLQEWLGTTKQSELPFEAYDLMSGVTGVAASLIRADEDFGGVYGALTDILDWLISRAQQGPMGFCTSAQDARPYIPYARSRVINCGMAHGVPGIVAVLAIARIAGIRRPGIDEAIKRLSDWTVSMVDTSGPDGWRMPYAATVCGEAPQSDPKIARVAWCYGLPGVARSLWLAGRALGSTELQDFGAEALYHAASQMAIDPGKYSPTFCHGLAGVLRIVQVFAADTGRDEFTRLSHILTKAIMSSYTRKNPAGFQNREDNGQVVDNCGLLNGSAGVALVLLSARETDEMRGWDRIFLMH